MIEERDIKAIARNFSWQISETEMAIKELREAKSIINSDEFLKACLENYHPDVRFEAITSFLIETLQNNPVDVICELLSIDPCFYALALFNLYSSNLDIDADFDDRKSFLTWKYPFDDPDFFAEMQEKKRKEKVIFLEDILPHHLTYRFLDEYVDHYIRGLNYDKEKLIIGVLKIKNIQAVNIEYFRWALCNPHYFNKDLFNKLVSILTSPFVRREEATGNRYWFFYAVVERLKQLGYSPMKSIKKSAELLTEAASSIQRRYYDKKKEAREEKLDLLIKKFESGLENLLRE